MKIIMQVKIVEIRLIIILILLPLFVYQYKTKRVSLVAQQKESACQCRRCGFNPWIMKIPWRRNGNPLQFSCWGNPMARGAWWTIVHVVTKESYRTQQLNNKTLNTIIFKNSKKFSCLRITCNTSPYCLKFSFLLQPKHFFSLFSLQYCT